MGVYETPKLCINGLQLLARILNETNRFYFCHNTQINAIFSIWTSYGLPCYESTALIIILVDLIEGDYLKSSKQIRKIIQSHPISTPEVIYHAMNCYLLYVLVKWRSHFFISQNCSHICLNIRKFWDLLLSSCRGRKEKKVCRIFSTFQLVGKNAARCST
jgi:hypothetical protein